MAKPGTEPKWDITEVNAVAPDTDHEQEGWLAPGGVPEKPPFETFNHWMNNVYKWVTYFTNEARRLWQNQKITHNITIDSDYALTAVQNSYGKIIITDTNPFLSTGRNIVVDTSERSFIFFNDTLQILTVKTAAGTGIPVAADTTVWLICDGTNVIESIDISEFIGGLTTDDFLHIQDQKPNNTSGGDAVADTFNQRDLNTVLTNTITGASLATDIITLPAGTYFLAASAPAYAVAGHSLRAYNNSDAAILLKGTSEYASVTYQIQTRAFVSGLFTIAASKNIILEHYTKSAKAGNGLGQTVISGDIEIFADIKIWKVG